MLVPQMNVNHKTASTRMSTAINLKAQIAEIFTDIR